jgi:hypothetical protein
MTVILCPSIENFCWPSAPALINLRRCNLSGVNLKLVIPALLLQGVLSPAAVAIEQLKLFRPLIRLLSETGPYIWLAAVNQRTIYLLNLQLW